MSDELRTRGQQALNDSNALLLEMAKAKASVHSALEAALLVLVRGAEVIQEQIEEARPLAELGVATETEEVEYTLLLHRRRANEEGQYQIKEAIGQINLPGEEELEYQKVILDGTEAIVES